jgi:excisionase family DNA binding protein
MTSLNPDKLYKTTEARELLGCGNTTLWKLIGNGELECRKLGRAAMIPGSSIAALIERLPRHLPKLAA